MPSPGASDEKMRDPGNEVGIVVALCPTENYVRGLSKQMRQCIFDGITQVLVTKSFMPQGDAVHGVK